VISATTASNGEITNIITTTPTIVSVDVRIWLSGLLQALREVVDVVGDPAQQVAALLAVDVRAAAAG
jgi:hypothetical protein